MKHYDALVFDLNGTLWLDAPTRLLPTGTHPDAPDVMAELAVEYPLYIVSNCHPIQMEEFLRSFTKSPFTETVHYGKYGNSKQQNLEVLKSKEGFKNPLYVGDSPSDQSAALRSGYHFVWAAYTAEGFELPAGPQLKTLKDLLKFVNLDPNES
jgi:phosphoglycolate phosphatase-like HAD superfamily hydrolase